MALTMDRPSAVHTTAFHLQDSLYPAAAKQPTQTYHTDSVLLLHSTASTYKTTLLLIMPATLNCNKTWSQPQHNPLSIHNNMHYTPSTAHYIAFHAQDNPSVHTSNTWQNGTRCRDGIKVLFLPCLVGF